MRLAIKMLIFSCIVIFSESSYLYADQAATNISSLIMIEDNSGNTQSTRIVPGVAGNAHLSSNETTCQIADPSKLVGAQCCVDRSDLSNIKCKNYDVEYNCDYLGAAYKSDSTEVCGEDCSGYIGQPNEVVIKVKVESWIVPKGTIDRYLRDTCIGMGGENIFTSSPLEYTCKIQYCTPGTQIQEQLNGIEAKASPADVFSRWTGDCDSIDGRVCRIKCPELGVKKEVIAIFEKYEPPPRNCAVIGERPTGYRYCCPEFVRCAFTNTCVRPGQCFSTTTTSQCVPSNGDIGAGQACCAGLTACNGKCLSSCGSTTTTCKQSGQSASGAAQCCAGLLFCSDSGICSSSCGSPSSCKAAGNHCEYNSECCSDLVCDQGYCQSSGNSSGGGGGNGVGCCTNFQNSGAPNGYNCGGYTTSGSCRGDRYCTWHSEYSNCGN